MPLRQWSTLQSGPLAPQILPEKGEKARFRASQWSTLQSRPLAPQIWPGNQGKGSISCQLVVHSPK